MNEPSMTINLQHRPQTNYKLKIRSLCRMPHMNFPRSPFQVRSRQLLDTFEL